MENLQNSIHGDPIFAYRFCRWSLRFRQSVCFPVSANRGTQCNHGSRSTTNTIKCFQPSMLKRQSSALFHYNNHDYLHRQRDSQRYFNNRRYTKFKYVLSTWFKLIWMTILHCLLKSNCFVFFWLLRLFSFLCDFLCCCWVLHILYEK